MLELLIRSLDLLLACVWLAALLSAWPRKAERVISHWKELE